MNNAAAEKLKFAALFLLTEAARKQQDILPMAWGTALDILDVLQDNEWHTSSEIAALVDKSPSHVKAILQQVRDAWALDTSNHKGFRLSNSTHKCISEKQHE